MPTFSVSRDMWMWVAATALVFGSLLGVGSALLQDFGTATWCGVAALIGGGTLWWLFQREQQAESSN